MSLKFTQLKPTTLGLDSVLDFGRHFGYTVSEVLKNRPEYIQWLIADGKKFYPSVQNEIYKIVASKDKPKYIPKDIYCVHADQDDWWDDIPF